GVVALVFLSFTDRKALMQAGAAVAATGAATPAGEDRAQANTEPLQAGDLEALTEAQQRNWRASQQQLAGVRQAADSATVLRQLVQQARQDNRPDYAGYYAGLLAAKSEQATDHLEAAQLLSLARRQYSQLKQAQITVRKLNTEAIAHYRAYLAAQPADALAQVGLASSLVQSDTPMDGIRALRELAENKQASVEVQYRANMELATFSIQTQQAEKALSRLSVCMALKPAEFEPYYLAGLAHKMQQQAEKARPLFEKALSLAPNTEIRSEIRALMGEESQTIQ
ncbi:MAG: hypothetical protein ACK5XP_11160, partial [Sphingobacteriia bacterium]